MEFLRKLAYALATTTLALSLYLLLASLFILGTIGNEALVKQQLRDSGIYKAMATDIATRATSESGDKQDPLVQAALTQTITGDTVGQFAEDAIGSTYSWVRGEAQTPSFTLHVDTIKPTLIANLTTQLRSRLESLPMCPKGVIPSNTDPFTASCLPTGVSIDKEIASQQAQIQAQADEAFRNTNLTANDIKVEKDGVEQPYYQGLSSLPKYYHWLVLAPRIAAISTVILIGLLVLLARPHEKGLKTSAIICLPVGCLLLLVGIFIPTVVDQLSRPIATSLKDSTYKEPVTSLVASLLGNTKSFLITQGIVLILIGALLVLWYTLDAKKRARHLPSRPATNA